MFNSRNKQPKSKIANNETELKQSILEIGFPVLLRPSYVLGEEQ